MPAPGRLLVFAPFSQNVVIIAWARDFEQRVGAPDSRRTGVVCCSSGTESSDDEVSCQCRDTLVCAQAKQCSERASTLEIVPQEEHEGRQVG